MKYRLLGRTGVYVSEIALGTMTWGGRGFWSAIGDLQLDAAKAQLTVALDQGVNLVDTADIYSEGMTERLLGTAIRDLGVDREDLVIATKARGRMGPGVNRVGLTRKHLMAAVDASLERLGLDYIDLYQVHGVDPVTPIEETLSALDDIVRSGKVRSIGLSNYPAWQIMQAIALAEARGLARFQSVQAYYSAAGRDLEREVVPLALDQGLGVLVWSPLAGGLLSGKFSADRTGPENARRTGFDFPPVDRQRAFAVVDRMRPMAEARGCSVARIALAWVLAQKGVTSVITGAKTLDQLQDNLAASSTVLTEEELAALDAVSRLPPEYPGWMLGFQAADRFPPEPEAEAAG